MLLSFALHLLRCGCISRPEKGSPYGAIYVRGSFLKPVLGGRSYFYMTRAGSPRRVTASAERVNALACPNDFLRLRFSGAPCSGLLLNGRAINYVNQKGHRVSWWDSIHRGYIQGSLMKCMLSSFLSLIWNAFQAASISFWLLFLELLLLPSELLLSNFEDQLRCDKRKKKWYNIFQRSHKYF